MNNPIFRIATNMQKQSDINQMQMEQMNQNIVNQFDQNMMIQNSYSNLNPMMNQKLKMNQENMMKSQMMNINMNMGQENMMNYNMNMFQGNMMNDHMMNYMNMNQGNMMIDPIMNQIDNNQMNQAANMVNIMNNMQLNENNSSQNEDNRKKDTFIKVIFRISDCKLYEIQIKPEEKVSELIKKYRIISGDNKLTKKFIFNAKSLNYDLTIAEAGITHNANIFVVSTKGIKGAGGPWYNKEINIKFIKSSKNCDNKISNCQLDGLLKLCLLKEISSKLNDDEIIKLPEIIKCIMIILKNGYILTEEDIKKTIKEVLKKTEGSNIINFSEFVDETIDTNQMDKMIKLLDSNDLKEINDIRFRLSKYNEYMEFFMKEFDKTKKESIFEFSVISLVVMEREDFEKFKIEREKCPNRVDKILYHGTSVEPISCILTDQFKKSVDRHYQHGKGVYFTDFLDYCWFYGGEESNRANKNIIPQIGDIFTLIACYVYYNKKGFRKVTNSKYTPKKNEINFAYAGAHFETVINPDFNKFLGTEYVIWDLDQICPFISAKLKRTEYCVIWRDNNFSSNPVYNNKFDEIFKKFLNERIKYIKQMAKYNIYPAETSEEALKLVERKKYNKIILISNVGTDLGGKKFVDKAREIIGNDVIALFLAYNIAHLKWIKDYKNALFSNDPKFYEQYLKCFEEQYFIKENLESLKDEMEKHYEVKFNFDDKFLDYPQYKDGGNYSDLSFNN